MKFALISPLEPRESGYRVAEVADLAFEIAQPLYWVECADDIVADVYWFNPEGQTFALAPPPAPPVQPTVQGAQTL